MKSFRLSNQFFVYSLFTVCCFGLMNCHEKKTAEKICQKQAEASIPPFIENLLDSAEWYADTICVVNDDAFYYAFETSCRTFVIFNKEKILIEDPTLWYDSISPNEKYKFRVYIGERNMIVDFQDPASLRELSSFDHRISSYTRYRKDTIADFCNAVSYSFCVDYPSKTTPHESSIKKWLTKKVYESSMSDYLLGSALHPEDYPQDTIGKESLAQLTADRYLKTIHQTMVSEKMLISTHLFLDICFQAWFSTDNMVTFLKYMHEHQGGAHGYFTEELISYDPVHEQEIDWDYLFKPECKTEVLQAFYRAVIKDPHYGYWHSHETMDDVIRHFTPTDDKGNLTADAALPQPGLGEEGVVFSFQPYAISCFAAGVFHFTIPYDTLQPYLTEKAKWCLKKSL